jgi:hypothetical protein
MPKTKSKSYVTVDGSLTSAMFIVFLVLKLTGTIDWSWWWVAAPLWLPFAIIVAVLLAALVIVGLVVGFIYTALGVVKAFEKWPRTSAVIAAALALGIVVVHLF